MKVLVVGATGVLGRPTVRRLLERGHGVVALVRDTERGRARLGPDTGLVEGDVLDADACARSAVGTEAVLHLATAIPRPPATDWARNDRIRTEGTRNLLAAARRARASRYVQQSIAFVYGDGFALGHHGAWLSESARLAPAPFIASAVEMEALVEGSGLPGWVILRGGAFYGAGTGTSEQLVEDVGAGRVAVQPDRDPYLSLVHVDDMAAAVVAAVEAPPRCTVYNVVDDEPVRHSELVRYLADLLGAPAPPVGTVARPSLRVRNVKLCAELGWRPTFPSFRQGFGALLAGRVS